jgi:hypothetical protein
VIPKSPLRSREALLVLPGFGYSRSTEKRLRSSSAAWAAEGVDLYVPNYVRRSGLAKSRAELLEFYRDHRLDQYERLHIFAFIAGAWTLNPYLEKERLPNLSTIVYDRSPMQERAPRIAADKLAMLTWLAYGKPVFEVARTAYPPVNPAGVRIGIVVETKPTGLVKRYAKTARSYGPLHFECDAFGQRYDDCVYLPMNHDELYVRFDELRPELLAFIRTGSFTRDANRAPPTGDPLATESPK